MPQQLRVHIELRLCPFAFLNRYELPLLTDTHLSDLQTKNKNC